MDVQDLFFFLLSSLCPFLYFSLFCVYYHTTGCATGLARGLSCCSVTRSSVSKCFSRILLPWLKPYHHPQPHPPTPGSCSASQAGLNPKNLIWRLSLSVFSLFFHPACICHSENSRKSKQTDLQLKTSAQLSYQSDSGLKQTSHGRRRRTIKNMSLLPYHWLKEQKKKNV